MLAKKFSNSDVSYKKSEKNLKQVSNKPKVDDKKTTFKKKNWWQKNKKANNAFKFKKKLSKKRSRIPKNLRVVLNKLKKNIAVPRGFFYDKRIRIRIDNYGYLLDREVERPRINYPLIATMLRKVFTQRLNILVKSNNVFCTLINISSNQTLYSTSSELFGVKITKKRLRYNYEGLLEKFLEIVEKIRVIPGGIIFKITAPIRIKQRIYDLLCKHFILRDKDAKKQRRLRFIFPHKKSFNGCRPVKKVRKKRHNIRFI